MKQESPIESTGSSEKPAKEPHISTTKQNDGTADRAEDLPLYEFEGLRLDTRRRLLTHPGRELSIALTPMQFDTLLFFVEHAGQLIDKEALIAQLWPDRVVEENNLNQHITALRHALGENRHERRFIMNVRGRGYRFVPDVMRLDQKLSPLPRSRHMGTTPTSDIAAWQCFQQALFQIGTDDPVQWSIGKDRLTHAIGLDPNFASALAILAVLRVRLFTIDWPNSTGFLEVAEHEAKRAVALRPELAFTHMAIGSVYAAQGQWVRAEESFVTAAGLDEEWPIVGAIHIAHVLLSVGHLKRALVLTTSSQAQPHGMIGILLIYAITYFANDCDEEALKLLALIQALGGRPHQPHLVELFIMAASRAGRVDEVIRLHNASLGPSILAAAGEDVVTTVVNALATQQGKPGAVDALDRLMARLAPAQATQTLRSRVLTWYTRLNGVDRAFALGHSMLDDFILQGTTGVFWGFLWSPEMQAFREDSRFDYFATRIGLTEYWQRFGPPS